MTDAGSRAGVRPSFPAVGVEHAGSAHDGQKSSAERAGRGHSNAAVSVRTDRHTLLVNPALMRRFR